MKIGILGATENEIMPLIDKMVNKTFKKNAMLNFYEGEYEEIQLVTAYSGVCKVNAAITTQIMISKYDVTHIIMTGVAGGLNEDLEIGDIIISTELAYHDVAPQILTEYHPWMESIYFKADNNMVEDFVNVAKSITKSNKCLTGRIITGEIFITEKERDKLIKEFRPLCVDMESTSVAHTCYVNDIPFIIIRSISDFANEDGEESFENNVKTASLNALELVEAVLKTYALNKAY